MEIKQTRLRNLLSLAEHYRRNIDFCERIEMNPTYFSQIKSGKKAVGDEIARKVEALLGLDRGYLDVAHGEDRVQQRAPSSEAMAVAYAIDSLPTPIRDACKRLIYQIAAAQVSESTALGNDVGPFKITSAPQDDHEQPSHPIQAAQ